MSGERFVRLVGDSSTGGTGSSVSLRSRELVDNGGLELPSWNSLLEENVKLSVRSTLGLGKSEVSPDETAETSSGPKVTRLGTPVPSGRVEHVRVQDADNDTTDVVQVSGQDDGLGSESSGTNLSDERVADWTNGDIVDEGEDDQKSTDSPSSGVRGVDCTEDTGEDHDGDEDALSVEVDVSSTERLHEEPRRGRSDTTDDEHDQVESRGSFRGKTGRLEEVSGGTLYHQSLLLRETRSSHHERRSRNGLDEPDNASNLSSSQVDTLEAVEEGDTDFLLLLELVGVVHHGNLLLGVLGTGVVGQSEDRSLGLLKLALSGEPPRRFRSEEDTDEDGDGPDPLDGKGNLVCPLGVVADQSSVDTGADDLSDNPTQVDVGGKERSDLDRHDLGGVGDSHGLESTPRETKEEVGSEQHLEGRSELIVSGRNEWSSCYSRIA